MSIIRITDDIHQSYSNYRGSVFTLRMYANQYLAFSFADHSSANW